MLSKNVAAAALALGALLAQPAGAGPLGLGLSAQWSDRDLQPVFHERDYGYYPAPPVYVEPPDYAPALLPPRQIERLLRRSGYSRIEVVALAGPIYTVQGIDPWDNYVEMKVFGQDGRVLRSDVIEGRLYDTPFAHRPPAAGPQRAWRPPIVPDDGPRIVGAIPQSPPQVTGRSQPQIATAPLPRERPAYRPPAAEPARGASEPVPVPGVPDERREERDPLVVY